MSKLIIGDVNYEFSPPFKPVYLNEEEIFKIDMSKYMGHRKNQESELCKVLSDKLGYNVTPKDLNLAMILNFIPDEPQSEEN